MTPVELIGVNTECHADRAAWWKLDGTLLSAFTNHSTSAEKNPYEFALRIREEDRFSYTAEGPSGKSVSELSVPKDGANKSLANLRVAVLARFASEETTTSVRVGVATGEWTNVDVWRDYRWEKITSVATSLALHRSCSSGLARSQRQFEITHTHVQEATRLVAFDSQGKLYESIETPGGSGKGLIQRHCRFRDLKLIDIQRFEFQRRPYDTWLTFTNISLRPGHRTEPQVKHEK